MKMYENKVQHICLSYENDDKKKEKLNNPFITEINRYDLDYLQAAPLLSRNNIFHCHF